MNEIDSYIQQFPEEVQEILKTIRKIVQDIAPLATERMCMGIPTFDLNGKWLVHYAGLKKHIGFYPQPEGVEAFKDKLEGYKTTKGAIQFPLGKPIPYELIREIVEYRANQAMKDV